MNQTITPFGLRADGPYVLVIGAESHPHGWKFAKQWNGQEWVGPDAPNSFAFDFKKYAEEHIAEHGPTMLANLPR